MRNLVLLLILTSSVQAAAASLSENTPRARNVLFLSGDELRPTLGCYGDSDPAHRHLLERMRSRLQNSVRATRGAGFLPEHRMRAIEESGGTLREWCADEEETPETLYDRWLARRIPDTLTQP